jgi:hypothetical protein
MNEFERVGLTMSEAYNMIKEDLKGAKKLSKEHLKELANLLSKEILTGRDTYFLPLRVSDLDVQLMVARNSDYQLGTELKELARNVIIKYLHVCKTNYWSVTTERLVPYLEEEILNTFETLNQ